MIQETAWAEDKPAALGARDNLFELMRVPRPAPRKGASGGSVQQRAPADEHESYASLVQTMGY